MASDAHPAHDSRLVWADAVIGFALGGFFDSILLHRVLQWRHSSDTGALRLYSHGALVVGSTPALGGCLAWTQG